MKQIMKIGNLDHVRKITIPWSSHVPRTVKASTLPAHNSPIDTLLIAIAVTRKWVDESAGRQGRMAHAASARYPIPGPSTSGTSRAIAARLCHRHERTHGARPARIPQLPACAANFSARAAKFPDYARKFPVPLRREFGCKSLNLLAD